MNLNGGYAMIAHDATQKDLEIAYKTKRPVLLYDADHRAHWAQINEKVIETFDEETHETITTYEYSYQLLNAIETLVDDSGNPRFIEGNGTPATIEGFEATYCKWSLSGTHLMIVLAGTIIAGTQLSNGVTFATFKVPNFIKNKILPLWANNFVLRATVLYSPDNWQFQTGYMTLGKFETLNIQQLGNITMNATSTFRIQFDLLIDNE